MMGDPVIDPTNKSLPDPLMQRPFFVRVDSMNTFRLMHDPPRPTNSFAGSRSFFSKSEVTYHINGADAFKAMADAISTTSGPGDFVYFANWFADLDVPIDGAKTLRSALSDAARGGVQVRAILWKNTAFSATPFYRLSLKFHLSATAPVEAVLDPWVKVAGNWVPPSDPPHQTDNDVAGNVVGPAYDYVTTGGPLNLGIMTIHGPPPYHNLAEVLAIRALSSPKPTGYCTAILDAQVPFAGGHHQKILIARGSAGVVAFVGGVDFNSDRLGMLYDVHCGVTGPAAAGVLSIFNERWDNHPQRGAAEAGQPHLGDGVGMIADLPDAVSDVQIVRTYADPRKKPIPPTGVPSNKQALVETFRLADPFYASVTSPYPFAPSGCTDTWEMYKTAIETARQYIYIENQYFTSIELANILARAVPNVNHLTILTQLSDIDLDGGLFRTKACVDILRAADPAKKKVRVFVRSNDHNPDDAVHDYVHAKLMIVDDRYAIVGSANAARRSFDFDSEASIGVFDRVPPDRVMASFARRLRMRVWLDNLQNEAPDLTSLSDGRAAAIYWDRIGKRGLGARTSQKWFLESWDHLVARASPGPHADDWEWNEVRDPTPPGPT